MYENGQLVVLNINDILPNRFQPRIRFDEVKLQELAESIHKYGVIQPIVVRPINNKYEIIAGERRFKASKLASRTTIPAIVVNLSDKDSEEIALLENIQRQELTAIEEAVSYKRILDMGYITQDGLAKKIGKSQSTIANKIRLLNLDDQVQDALLHGRISERHARSLLRLGNRNAQVMMLGRIISERLTVKRTDDEIKKYLLENPSDGVGASVKTISHPVKVNVLNDKPVVESLFDNQIKKDSFTKDNSMNEERGKGFMDIDKIMREAHDINETKQPNDISELMRGSSMPSPSGNVAPTPAPVNNDNKFVNIPYGNNEVQRPSEVKPTNSGSVSFDSIFNQTPADLKPSTPDNNSNGANNTVNNNVLGGMPRPQESVGGQVSSNQVNNMASGFGSNVTSGINQSQVSNQGFNPAYHTIGSSSNANTEGGNSSAYVNQKSLNNQEISSIPEVSSSIPEVTSATNTPSLVSSSSDVRPTPSLVTPSFSTVNSGMSQSVPEVTSVNDSLVQANSLVSPSTPTVSNMQESVNNVSSIGSGLDDYRISEENLNNIPTPDIIETASSPVSQPSMMENNVKAVSTPNNSFREVINLIRNCADEIEKLGYYVDVDEIDLDKNYQVTFKINKE